MNDISSNIAIAQSEWSADELIPFGKYILLDRITSGATAAVYRANVRGEAGFERLVAIKRILPHMAGDRDFVDTFVREAKTVARLAHAGICPIYELGKVGESLYMAVEYIQGKDLGLIMRKLARSDQTMPHLIAAWVAARLCDALDYAHRLKNAKGVRTGMIHRDLSPSNILVSYEGQVKLIDFGLARAVGRAQSTNVDALKKKLSYMSPEMVKGRQLDARSDIFGVGICLYEMVTGRRLFAASNDIETLKLVSRASVPPPSAVVDDAPDELEIVIMHSLEREPEDRFQSAAEMGEALNAYLQKADPGFNPQRLSDWMQELFSEDIQEEQQRIKRLLAASADPELIRQRRVFFASPSGAAARARAEIERRLSTEPPSARLSLSMPMPMPKAAPIPREASTVPTGVFDEEPTGFYDPEKTTAAPNGLAAQIFDEEPTAFYDEKRPLAAPAPPTAFEDEPTQFLVDTEIEDVRQAHSAGTGGFDEEPTEIFFNKQEGVGIQELLDEINDVEAPGPLNRPIVAPELGLPAPARMSVPPGPAPAPASWSAPTSFRPSVTGALPKHPAIWPFVAAGVVLLAAIVALIARTPVGIALGLRAPAAGTIEVRANPGVRTDIQLDDVYRGHAPLRMEGVRSGTRRLEIRADGYLPVTREVQLEGGGTALIDITLVEDRSKQAPPEDSKQGLQPATAEPAVAKPSRVPPAHATSGSAEQIPSVPSSHHHHSSGRRPDATEGQPTPMAQDPSAVPPGTPGTLAINTVPWSLVFIDGRDTGRSTPVLGYPISPGTHEIRLQTATGQTFIERIEVQAGQAVQITRRFQ